MFFCCEYSNIIYRGWCRMWWGNNFCPEMMMWTSFSIGSAEVLVGCCTSLGFSEPWTPLESENEWRMTGWKIPSNLKMYFPMGNMGIFICHVSFRGVIVVYHADMLMTRTDRCVWRYNRMISLPNSTDILIKFNKFSQKNHHVPTELKANYQQAGTFHSASEFLLMTTWLC